MRADDLQKLMTYYGFDVTIGSPPFPPEGWREHPTAPGWFYKGQRVLTEAQLRAEVAQAVVAE
ncbi:hypothetical protein B5V02_19525 [Mesorhizobium kowhaii]|uniref:Uncharacterized protein n=2 Tax=Mesorhizobium kowhaii TaxID=1300272 RepID=A0A2W7C218_9HYPH|nr:hypothetical protein B5V02_19525 [Mesorhizobium kowhaii]